MSQVWPTAAVLALVPLSTNTYGQVDDADGYDACAFGGDSSTAYIWLVGTFYGALLLSSLLMFVMIVQVLVHFRKNKISRKHREHIIFRATRFYPLGLLFVWLPSCSINYYYLVFSNIPVDQNSAIEFNALECLTTQNGTVLALIFFTYSPSIRQLWSKIVKDISTCCTAEDRTISKDTIVLRSVNNSTDSNFSNEKSDNSSVFLDNLPDKSSKTKAMFSRSIKSDVESPDTVQHDNPLHSNRANHNISGDNGLVKPTPKKGERNRVSFNLPSGPETQPRSISTASQTFNRVAGWLSQDPDFLPEWDVDMIDPIPSLAQDVLKSEEVDQKNKEIMIVSEADVDEVKSFRDTDYGTIVERGSSVWKMFRFSLTSNTASSASNSRTSSRAHNSNDGSDSAKKINREVALTAR